MSIRVCMGESMEGQIEGRVIQMDPKECYSQGLISFHVFARADPIGAIQVMHEELAATQRQLDEIVDQIEMGE